MEPNRESRKNYITKELLQICEKMMRYSPNSAEVIASPHEKQIKLDPYFTTYTKDIPDSINI